MRTFWQLLKQTYREWSDDRGSMMGAALAYYTVFSLAPLLIIVIACASIFFGHEAVTGELMNQIRGLVGNDGAEAINTMIASAAKEDVGGLANVIGLATLLFGATGLFIQLQDSLDKIWDVESAKSQGVIGYFRNRWVSLTMVMAIGFLLLVSLVASAAISFLAPFSTRYLPFSGALLQLLNIGVSLLLTTFLFALLFKYLPSVYVRWRDIWVGAFVSAILFAIGKQLIGMYLGRAAVSSTFGAAGSLVIVLLWSYYSAQILLFGAEFTRVYTLYRKDAIEPRPGFITKRTVEYSTSGEPMRLHANRGAP